MSGPAVVSLTVEDHPGDMLETTKQTFMNSMAPTQLVRNKLHSISEQNESSKPTSKIESSSQQHHFLSSMVTMRSMQQNIG